MAELAKVPVLAVTDLERTAGGLLVVGSLIVGFAHGRLPGWPFVFYLLLLLVGVVVLV